MREKKVKMALSANSIMVLLTGFAFINILTSDDPELWRLIATGASFAFFTFLFILLLNKHKGFKVK
jgi:hypothetical protein